MRWALCDHALVYIWLSFNATHMYNIDYSFLFGVLLVGCFFRFFRFV